MQDEKMTFRFPHNVKGWLTEAEGRALYEAARGKTVIEIGAYHGRSTICMAQSAKVLHTIDWGFGDAGSGWDWSTPDLLRNLTEWPPGGRTIPQNVIIHVGRVEDIAPLFQKRICDMVFVDGCHSEEAAFRDICLALAWLPLSGGILALHDWNYDSVQKSFRDAMAGSYCKHCGSIFAGEGQCQFCRTEIVDNLRIQLLS